MPPLLSIRVLGMASLSLSGQESVAPALLQPRKIALLAYLGVEDRPVSRDEIAAVLWTEAPQDRSRASLNQLIHTIRRDCAAEVIGSVGKNLVLNAALVSCDAAEFFRSLETTSAEELVGAFAPHFMPGFSLTRETGFEDWQVRQGERYNLALADAAWRAAAECRDFRRGLQYLRLASELRPFDEGILRQRMRLLTHHGSPAEALVLYEEYRQLLARELDAAPAPDTRALASELVSLSDCTPDGPVVPHQPTPEFEECQRASREPQARVRWRVPLIAVGACVVLVAAVVGIMLSRDVSAVSKTRPLVTLAGLTVAGGDEQRRGEFHHILTALLADDTAFDVTLRSTPRSNIVLSGEIKLESDRTHGTLLLSDRGGRVLRSLSIAHASGADLNVAKDIGNELRTAIWLTLPLGTDAAGLATFQARLEEAKQQGVAGAYIVAENSLSSIAADLEATATMAASDRQRLNAEIWELRAWNSLRQGENDLAVRQFRRAVGELNSANMHGAGVRERHARLHYLVWSLDSRDESTLGLRSAMASLSGIPPQQRSAAEWHVLAMILSGLEMYQEAYVAADIARTRSPQLAASLGVGVLLFRTAFDAGNDHAARMECHSIREHSPHSMPGVGCAAMLSGWTGADYEPAALLGELEGLQEPEPIRTVGARQMKLLVAAAAARRGNVALADPILATFRGQELDNSEKVFVAAALRARGKTAEADELVRELSRTPSGRRTLTVSRRLLQS